MAALKITPSVHSLGHSRPSSARTTGTGANLTVDLLTYPGKSSSNNLPRIPSHQKSETNKAVDKMTPEQISGMCFMLSYRELWLTLYL